MGSIDHHLEFFFLSRNPKFAASSWWSLTLRLLMWGRWKILFIPSIIIFFQSSYLSQISQIIFVEKNLSCGEISDFCKEFEQFMEFYRNLCRFCSKFVWRKICVEKEWQIWGLSLSLMGDRQKVIDRWKLIWIFACSH